MSTLGTVFLQSAITRVEYYRQLAEATFSQLREEDFYFQPNAASNSLAMIIARTDVEGRWVYQKMREAAPGYRVRGDIKLGSPVRIILEPVAQ